MATDFKLSNAAASAAADAVCDLLDGGSLKIYTATKPATVDTEITDQTLLAELAFGTPAFGAADDGVVTAEAITEDSAANATGTAAWFRAFTAASAPIFDGTVGTSDADLILNSVAIQAGAEVSITSLTYTQPKASA